MAWAVRSLGGITSTRKHIFAYFRCLTYFVNLDLRLQENSIGSDVFVLGFLNSSFLCLLLIA